MENPIPYMAADTLSAADVFGAASELAAGAACGAGDAAAACAAEGAGAAAAAGGAALELGTLALVLLYIYVVVHCSAAVRAILLSAAGIAPSRRRRSRHVNASLQRKVETAAVVLGIAGAAVAAAAAVRIFRAAGTAGAAGASAAAGMFGMPGIERASAWLPAGLPAAAACVAVGALLFAAFGWIGVSAAGFASGRGDVCKAILQAKFTHAAALSLFAAPLCAVSLFAARNLAQGCFCILALECLISAILFAKETFSLFISQRVSILYWILYLCTLELFPASLLLAPVVRAGSGL